MSLEVFALVIAIHAIALVSPGPDFAVVTRLSIVSGRRAGMWAATGVAASIGIYVLVCLLGLSLVLAALPGLSRFLSIAGALYLAWLGIQCLRSTGALPTATASPHDGHAFLTGLFTNLLNPKAMLYFGSILSQVIGTRLSPAEGVLLWAVLVVESMLWFSMVAGLFSSQKVLRWLSGRLKWFDRMVGVVLLGLAAKVAASSR